MAWSTMCGCGSVFLWLLRWSVVTVTALTTLAAVCVGSLYFIDPPFTSVQIQRLLENRGRQPPYVVRQTYVPLARISPHLRHAVIAAEDGRFYEHRGVDWVEVRKVLATAGRGGRLRRGASTITQQVVKNVFLTTDRSLIRKAVEIPLALLAEVFLPKERILELYLNVAEWGPGVFGAEEAARYHYGISSAALSRDQASRLAACLPAPGKRRPQQMDGYSAVIRRRMQAVGW